MSINCCEYNADFQQFRAEGLFYVFFLRSTYSNKIIWPWQLYYEGTENLTWPPGEDYYLTVHEYTFLKLQGKVA